MENFTLFAVILTEQNHSLRIPIQSNPFIYYVFLKHVTARRHTICLHDSWSGHFFRPTMDIFHVLVPKHFFDFKENSRLNNFEFFFKKRTFVYIEQKSWTVFFSSFCWKRKKQPLLCINKFLTFDVLANYCAKRKKKQISFTIKRGKALTKSVQVEIILDFFVCFEFLKCASKWEWKVKQQYQKFLHFCVLYFMNATQTRIRTNRATQRDSVQRGTIQIQIKSAILFTRMT